MEGSPQRARFLQLFQNEIRHFMWSPSNVRWSNLLFS